MRSWILNLRFVQAAIRQAGIDAFRLAEKDVLETLAEDMEKRATQIATERLAAMLTTVDEKQILTMEARTKKLYVGGEEASEGMLANLVSEAQFLEASELWKLLHETPKQLAMKAMFTDDGKLETQMLKGRAILYTLDTQKKIVQLLTNLSTPH